MHTTIPSSGQTSIALESSCIRAAAAHPTFFQKPLHLLLLTLLLLLCHYHCYCCCRHCFLVFSFGCKQVLWPADCTYTPCGWPESRGFGLGVLELRDADQQSSYASPYFNGFLIFNMSPIRRPISQQYARRFSIKTKRPHKTPARRSTATAYFSYGGAV